MSTVNDKLDSFLDRDYEAGFVTQIESETFPKGLDEDVIRRLSAIKRGESTGYGDRAAASRQSGHLCSGCCPPGAEYRQSLISVENA